MASPAKKLAFRRLLEIEMVDIIFLQETLAPSDQIIPALEALALGWHFKALDVHGQFGGESRRRGNRWARNRGGTYAGVEMQCDIDVLR